jgi:hypothetical protein
MTQIKQKNGFPIGKPEKKFKGTEQARDDEE